jgi:hypothetical protein
MQIWPGKLFLLNVCGFCRGKILRILAVTTSIQSGQSASTAVLDLTLLKKDQFSHQTHAVGLGFQKNSKNSGRDSQNFGHLVQPVTKDLRDHRYPSVLTQ